MRGLMFRKRLNILKSKGERFYEEKIQSYTSYENPLIQKTPPKKNFIIRFGLTALLEIIGYLPWLFIFLEQARKGK